MLNLFRRGGVAQLVVGAVAVTIIVVFALEFRPGRGAIGRLSAQCAVRVFDSCVEPKEYMAAYGLIVPYGASQRMVKQLGLRRQVMEGLAERELLAHEAKRLGIGITEHAVDDELAAGRFHVSLPASARTLSRSLFLCKVDQATDRCEPGSDMVRYVPDVKNTSGEFDYKKYERIVRNVTNRGAREFKEMQERELLAARMRNLVRARVRISVEEARMQFERERSKATVRTVTVNRDWIAKYAAPQSDEAVELWAKQNKEAVDSAWSSEKATFVADCPLASEIVEPFGPEASDDDKANAQAKLEQAEKRLKAGESFESVARRVSGGQTAASGGYLGCVNDSYGSGAAEVLQNLGTLKPEGVSPIFESPRGFHIVQFHGKLKKDDVESVGRRAVARRLATNAAIDRLAKDFANRLLDQAKSGVKLEQASHDLAQEFLTKADAKTKPGEVEAALGDELAPKLSISAPFSVLGSPIPDALPSEAAASKAFELDKPDALHPAPIATEHGYAIMQLKEKEPVKPEQFAKERDEIVRSLQDAKAADALARYVAALRKAAGDKVQLDAQLMQEPATKEQPGDT